MMPQDSGPIARYPSFALKGHIFEEVPTIVAAWRSIWIYTILEKEIHNCEIRPKMRTIDRSPL